MHPLVFFFSQALPCGAANMLPLSSLRAACVQNIFPSLRAHVSFARWTPKHQTSHGGHAKWMAALATSVAVANAALMFPMAPSVATSAGGAGRQPAPPWLPPLRLARAGLGGRRTACGAVCRLWSQPKLKVIQLPTVLLRHIRIQGVPLMFITLLA